MSARKLGRFAGLVFVLAVVFGAVGAVSIEHARASNKAGVQAQTASLASPNSSLTLEWD